MNEKPATGARARHPRKRRHAAARSRVVAGVLSVATFLGLGGSMAIRSAATATAAGAGAGGSPSSSTSSSTSSSSSKSTDSGPSGSSSWSAQPAAPTSGGSVASNGS